MLNGKMFVIEYWRNFMRYMISAILLWLSLGSSLSWAMDVPRQARSEANIKIAVDNLKNDCLLEVSKFRHLIGNPNWIHFYEYVEKFMTLQQLGEGEDTNKEIFDASSHSKELWTTLDRCDDGFLGFSKNEMVLQNKCKAWGILVVRCNSNITRAVSSLDDDAFESLFCNHVKPAGARADTPAETPAETPADTPADIIAPNKPRRGCHLF